MLLIVALMALLVAAILLKKFVRDKLRRHAATETVPARPARRLALVALLVCISLLAAAVLTGRSTASLQLSGVRSSGTVTALRLNSSGPRSTYDPLVRFKTPSGDIVEFEGEGSNPPDRRVGEVVEVLYAADRPTHAMINRGARDWFIPAGFALCALPIGLLAARAFARG